MKADMTLSHRMRRQTRQRKIWLDDGQWNRLSFRVQPRLFLLVANTRYDTAISTHDFTQYTAIAIDINSEDGALPTPS